MKQPCQEGGPSRRAVLQSSAAIGILAAAGIAPVRAAAPGLPVPVMAPVSITVNGRLRALQVDTRATLLDTLRETLDLTGTKKGCDHGQCGACTVLINGRRTNACLTLAVMHQGDDVVTIEGLGTVDGLHPMQAAFLKHDGFQCGYCTPGQICSAVGMLAEHRAGWPSHATRDVAAPGVALSDAEIQERMSGNLCRCSAYPNIVSAIREVAQA